MSIEKLGFNKWFKDKIDSTKLAGCHIARVSAVNRNNYLINDGNKDVPAEPTGKLMFTADSPLDFPAVGDWVCARYLDNESFAVIHEILPRKSMLKRKTPGKKIEFQLIAANIDTALTMQSLDTDYNIRRLERYLVMIHEGDIHPVVLLSKSDLLKPEETEKKKAAIHKAMPNSEIVAFSNHSDSGLDPIRELLVPGRTYCLIGSSGVGKTTLLNNLMGKALFQTQAVREKDGKGRYTTARRQLIVLENGSIMIDTPGMRELGNMDVETGLWETFGEIAQLSDQCRYKDCTHTLEKGCAVLAALEDGIISHERYQNYIKMRKESLHYEMSYLEKRRKDKQFGKFCKSAMKQRKEKR